MEKLRGRDIEEVQEFVLELLDQWVGISIDDDTLEDGIRTAGLIQTCIRHDVMINKHAAKWLEDLLSEDLRKKLDHWQYESRNPMLAVGVLSIYSDAWAMYCRPGAYTI